MYTLGQNFSGEAKRKIKTYRKRGYKAYRGNGGTARTRPNNWRIRSSWLRGVKGCFVCGRDHMTNENNSRAEVIAAIERLKKNHPSTLVSLADLDYITNELNNPDPEDKERDTCRMGRRRRCIQRWGRSRINCRHTVKGSGGNSKQLCFYAWNIERTW